MKILLPKLFISSIDLISAMNRITNSFTNMKRFDNIVNVVKVFERFSTYDGKCRNNIRQKIIDIMNRSPIDIDEKTLIMSIFESFSEPIKEAISISSALENLEIFDYILNFNQSHTKIE